MLRPYFIAVILFVWVFTACNKIENAKMVSPDKLPSLNFMEEPVSELTELRVCDILIKPNHNWLYGSSMVSGGSGFGHAVIVVEGATGSNALEILSKATIFESQAHRVPDEFQLRLAPGYLKGNDYRFANTNFGQQNAGYRYRLRLPLSDSQKDSILHFIREQDADVSSWRSQKLFRTHGNKNCFYTQADQKQQWYCSLLIWQAFYTVLGVDLDSNGGLMVYPNDLVTHPIFNDTKEEKRRIRF